MVVAEPVEGGDRLGRVLLPVVVDEGESLALAGHLVLGEEDARDVAEGPEELKGGFFKHDSSVQQEVSAKRRDNIHEINCPTLLPHLCETKEDCLKNPPPAGRCPARSPRGWTP